MTKAPRTPKQPAPPAAAARRQHRRHAPASASSPAPASASAPAPALAPVGNTVAHPADGPQFAQPVPMPESGHYAVPHPSDTQAYKVLDSEQRAGELQPTAFPPSRGGAEPRLTLADILGPFAQRRLDAIQQAGRLVFHSVGDTGNVRSSQNQDMVAAKMITDFSEGEAADVPSFFLHLGDVIYNFGEVAYYYDQFYDPYRDYPAPIVAIAGNHDGIVSPLTTGRPLDGFLRNFCAESFEVMPEAGGLDRTAQIQPGVYYTFEAPFLRVLALYSNSLEDPGVISTQGGQFPAVTELQLDFLRAALARVKSDKFTGALIIAHHHPIFTYGSTHGDSPKVLADIDAICKEVGVWPHAVLSAHAHNYQRYTRRVGKRQVPYIVAGNGGHNVRPLAGRGGQTIRVPAAVDKGGETIVLENYDDTDYGYLRIIVTATQLRIEYHLAYDLGAVKAPDDSVTIELSSGTIAHFTG